MTGDRAGVVLAGVIVVAVLLVASLAIGTVALVLSSPAGAQTGDEIANGTVNVTDPANESVWVDVEFAANNSEVEVYLENETGVEEANSTLTGADGVEESVEFSVDSAENYTVRVYGDESDVAGLWIGVGDGDGSAVIVPSGGNGVDESVLGGGVLLLLVIGLLLVTRD